MDERRAWVMGGSGAVGRFLLRRLSSAGWRVQAPSRQAAPGWSENLPRIDWRHCDLGDAAAVVPEGVDVVFGAGPLDLLVTLLQRRPPPRRLRVVALSSTSLETKRASPDPAERALAARLDASERALRELARAQDWSLVLIRPTLIYGAGVDASLSPLLRLARRRGWLLLPRASRGLRQPVHADDLAAAMLCAAQREEWRDECLRLPGGETLHFDRMVERVLALAEPQPRLLQLPTPPLRLLAALLAHGPRSLRRWSAPLLRSAQDLVFPLDDWQRLALQPRGFRPRPDEFDTGE